MRGGISADHGGFSLKGKVAESLRRSGYEPADFWRRSTSVESYLYDNMPEREGTKPMSMERTASLLSIGDEDLKVINHADDVRGRKVLDNLGAEIGHIDDLLVDDREHKVRFLRVAAGGFLGLGETRFLVPIDAITKVDATAVHVDQARDHVASGPQYDPKLINRPHLNRVYGHYGYDPYWETGYTYPMLPYGPGSLPC